MGALREHKQHKRLNKHTRRAIGRRPAFTHWLIATKLSAEPTGHLHCNIPPRGVLLNRRVPHSDTYLEHGAAGLGQDRLMVQRDIVHHQRQPGLARGAEQHAHGWMSRWRFSCWARCSATGSGQGPNRGGSLETPRPRPICRHAPQSHCPAAARESRQPKPRQTCSTAIDRPNT